MSWESTFLQVCITMEYISISLCVAKLTHGFWQVYILLLSLLIAFEPNNFNKNYAINSLHSQQSSFQDVKQV